MNHDQPQAENTEESKLEWGPELGPMSWNDAQQELEKINLSLKTEEKKWRLPTKDELLSIVNNNLSDKYNFQETFYWSSTLKPSGALAFLVRMNDGKIEAAPKEERSTKDRVKIVR